MPFSFPVKPLLDYYWLQDVTILIPMLSSLAKNEVCCIVFVCLPLLVHLAWYVYFVKYFCFNKLFECGQYCLLQVTMSFLQKKVFRFFWWLDLWTRLLLVCHVVSWLYCIKLFLTQTWSINSLINRVQIYANTTILFTRYKTVEVLLCRSQRVIHVLPIFQVNNIISEITDGVKQIRNKTYTPSLARPLKSYLRNHTYICT